MENKLYFANFTCRFGSNLVMLDLFDEIVKPAFFESAPREFRSAKTFLFDLELIDVGAALSPEPAITGRFVRDTDLKRNYVLRAAQLVEDRAQIESATSARFTLVLSTHTLLYMPETPYAPTLKMFEATIQAHLVWAWQRYLKSEVKIIKAQKPSKTLKNIKTELLTRVPVPELQLLELPSKQGVDDFLAQFSKIAKVEFRLTETNHSTDFSEVVASLRLEKESTQSSSITLVENNPKNKESLSVQLQSATIDGNVAATVTGTTHEGGALRGSNDRFNLTVPVSDMPENIAKGAKKMYQVFAHLLSQGTIRAQRAKGDLAKKLNRIL